MVVFQPLFFTSEHIGTFLAREGPCFHPVLVFPQSTAAPRRSRYSLPSPRSDTR